MRLPPKPKKYNEFAETLHEELTTQGDHKKAWLPFPNQKQLTYGTRRIYRSRINRGELLGKGFEARIHAGYLYVRVRP